MEKIGLIPQYQDFTVVKSKRVGNTKFYLAQLKKENIFLAFKESVDPHTIFSGRILDLFEYKIVHVDGKPVRKRFEFRVNDFAIMKNGEVVDVFGEKYVNKKFEDENGQTGSYFVEEVDSDVIADSSKSEGVNPPVQEKKQVEAKKSTK